MLGWWLGFSLLFRIYVKFYHHNKCVLQSIDSSFWLTRQGFKQSSLLTPFPSVNPPPRRLSDPITRMALLGSSLILPTWVNYVSSTRSSLGSLYADTLPLSLVGSSFTPPCDAVTLRQPVAPSFFFFPLCIVRLCACVSVFVSCALRGSFRLIKEMIYRSMMLEEFPDRSSNLLKWALSTQPQSTAQSLAPETHAYVYIHTHTRKDAHAHTHVSTIYRHMYIFHNTYHSASMHLMSSCDFSLESRPLLISMTKYICKWMESVGKDGILVSSALFLSFPIHVLVWAALLIHV